MLKNAEGASLTLSRIFVLNLSAINAKVLESSPPHQIPPLLRFIPADCSFSNVNGARLGAKVSPLSAGHWGCGTDLMGSDRRELISFKGDLICGMNVVTLNGHINDRYHSQTLAIHKAPFCWMHQCCVESHDLCMSCPCIVFPTS